MAYVLQFAPQSFVNIPSHGTIQFHPSLLPLHRGPSSISWPIALGAPAHRHHDLPPHRRPRRRPVVLQKTCAIGADETLGEVYFNKLFPLGVAALLEATDLVMAGRHEEQVQDERPATYEAGCTTRSARSTGPATSTPSTT
jgi:methionyl-tRNA formyltransferase